MANHAHSAPAPSAEGDAPISPAIAAMLAPFFGKESSTAPLAAVTPSNRPAPTAARALEMA